MLAKIKNCFTNNTLLGYAGIGATLVALGLYLADRLHSTTSGGIEAPGVAVRPILAVGGSRVVLESKEGILFSDRQDSLLSVRLVKGKLLISTLIRNDKGDLLAEMVDNNWNHQSRPAIFDRNYTKNALEIRDSKGDVVLQAVDLGPAIYVAAVLYCRNGASITIGPDPVGGGAIFDMLKPGATPDFHISPICDYPSEQKLGSCPRIGSIRIPEAGGQEYKIYAGIPACAVLTEK